MRGGKEAYLVPVAIETIVFFASYIPLIVDHAKHKELSIY